MAFSPATVGGNIVSDGNGISFLTYQTEDTEAVVVTPGYFKNVDVNGQLTSGEVTADGMFNDLDIILVQASDGLFQAEMSVDTDSVSCVALASEV